MKQSGIWLLEPMRSSLRNREKACGVFEKELVTNLEVIQCPGSRYFEFYRALFNSGIMADCPQCRLTKLRFPLGILGTSMAKTANKIHSIKRANGKMGPKHPTNEAKREPFDR